jgi:WD40 repeat protein
VLSPDGKVLAVTYQPAGLGIFRPFAVKLWDVETGRESHDLPGHYYYVNAMAFSPDGKHLVTGSRALSDFTQKQLKQPADQVFVWEVATGKAVARLPVGATAAAFAPDGKALAVAEEDGTIKFWEAAKWAVTGEFRGPRPVILAMTYGPDGQFFTGGVEATALAWDPRFAKAPAERK